MSHGSTIRTLALPVTVALLVGAASAQSLDEIASQFAPYHGPSTPGVDPTTMTGKVLCGYQGWFRTPDDGADMGWFHYSGRRGFQPGSCTIDLWPDVSELEADELYETPFRLADGSPAYVFSSHNRKTVLRHFQWMQSYGIDGVFVQRFTVYTRDPRQFAAATRVLDYCREGANRSGRAYAVMYDTDFDAASLDAIRRDWIRLVDHMEITADPAYLRHGGKPVIALWGCGFTHRRFDADATRRFIEFLRTDPTYGGLTVMLGVPTYWRTLDNDCRRDAALHDVLASVEVISPWMVGRSHTLEDVERFAEQLWRRDMAWCAERGVEYMPVVYPGFSWHNMEPESPLDMIPRLGGRFLWRQYEAATRVGATMIYQAMFDEIDEGTAIFKCTNSPPVGASPFLTYEGLPSDYYLRLVGEGAKLLRGEAVDPTVLPK